MLRILAAVMLLLPVNLQPVRASRQDAGAKSSLTVKMKDATLSSVFAEVERTSRYAFIYTDDVRPLLDRRVSVSVRSATIDELLSAVLKGTELTGRVKKLVIENTHMKESLGNARENLEFYKNMYGASEKKRMESVKEYGKLSNGLVKVMIIVALLGIGVGVITTALLMR